MSFTNQQPWAGVAGAPDGIVMVRTANFFTLLDGPPQGVLAGQSGSASVPPDMVWDWIHKQLYICTVSSGKASDTVWTQIEFVGPFVGTDIYAETINVSGSIQDDGNLVVKGGSNLTGPVTIGSDLTVAGNESLGGNLSVGGTLTALAGGNLGGTFTGNPIFNFNITPIQDIRLPNNIFIESADTAGTYRRLLGTDSSNQTYVANSGGNVVGFLNQALSQWLVYFDNAGNGNISGSLGMPGTMTSGAVVTNYLQDNGNIYVGGSGTVNGTLGINGGLYPNAGIVNIGGIGGFDMYNSGGQSVLNFASNQYIIYNGSLNYRTDGNHYFNNAVVADNVTAYSTVTGGYIHSTGNVQADGALTGGACNVGGGQVTCGDVHTNTLHADSDVASAQYVHAALGLVGAFLQTTGTSTHGWQFWDDGTNFYARKDATWDAYLGSFSDARLKKDVEPSKVDCLEVLQGIELSQFRWTENDTFVPIGFTTQQLGKVFPGGVNSKPANAPPGAEFYESVNTNGMLGLLVGAVQQLYGMISAGMKS